MKKILSFLLIAMFSASLFGCVSCSKEGSDDNNGKDNGGDNGKVEKPTDLASEDLSRAIKIADAGFSFYFEGSRMFRYYNPFTKAHKGNETGSVWMYTSAIESTVGILDALDLQKKSGNASLYDAHFARYKDRLAVLFDGLKYYRGTYTLTSYTQTKSWSVYAVNRASSPDAADVTGVLNVYDDQEWLIRELLLAHKVTGEAKYLAEAEYLAEYVADGWDTTLDAQGNENGGITWGPGYVTKHACSVGPFISPCVWLSEIYAGKSDEITVGYVKPDNTRAQKVWKKSDFYKAMAEKAYDWQKRYLLTSDGVYDDFMGGHPDGQGSPQYEVVDGEQYRKNTPLRDRVGPAYAYNSGTMVSGAVDLYRLTKDGKYLNDLQTLVGKSFERFAKLGTIKPGYYSYDVTGFNVWFTNVLMRSYVEASSVVKNADKPVESFQSNLDYGWASYNRDNLLPTNVLGGWNRDNSKNDIEGMFTFSFASEYAALAKYILEHK